MLRRDFLIRSATNQDTSALLAIYAPYVLETAITFEYEVPSVEEFSQRIRQVQKKFPYFVAEIEGEIAGYAYACPFHERAAYEWAVETAIYVKKDQKRQGIGRELYATLEKTLAAQNILNLNACIAYPNGDDPYLTLDSVRFHTRCGYQLVGEFHQCGYKFGRWYNMIWMEKSLGEHTLHPLPVKSFTEIREQIRQQYGIV